MGAIARRRLSGDRLIKYHGDGGSVTLRRLVTLRNPTTDEPALSLEVHADAAEGATAVSLRRTGSAHLRGAIPAGATVTIGGSDYTTASDATVVSNVIALALTTGLGAAATAGDAATVGQYAEATYKATSRALRITEFGGGNIQMGERAISLSRAASGARTPLPGDITDGGQQVLDVRTHDGGWVCRVGPAS